MKSKRLDAMAAFTKLLVLIAIFLLASNANAFTSLNPVAGSQVQENHLIQFEAVNGINTSYMFEAVNGVNARPFEAVSGLSHVHVKDIVNNQAGASQPTVAKTSDGDEVNDMINAHDKQIVTGQVTISDE